MKAKELQAKQPKPAKAYRIRSRAQRKEPKPYLSYRPGLRGRLQLLREWLQADVVARFRGVA